MTGIVGAWFVLFAIIGFVIAIIAAIIGAVMHKRQSGGIIALVSIAVFVVGVIIIIVAPAPPETLNETIEVANAEQTVIEQTTETKSELQETESISEEPKVERESEPEPQVETAKETESAETTTQTVESKFDSAVNAIADTFSNLTARKDTESEVPTTEDTEEAYKTESVEADTTEETEEDTSVDTSVTFAEIYREFDSNEIRAKEKYNGNRYQITGTVNGISSGGLLNLFGGATLTMENRVDNTIVFYYAKFGSDQEEALKNINKGDTITFVGECWGGTFSDCVLQ